MGLKLESQRLVMTEPAEDDMDGLLSVASSNPDPTGDHEASGGESGRFDRDMLERDLAVAWIDPARHPLVLRPEEEPTRLTGWAEVLDEHPHVITSPGSGCSKSTSGSSAPGMGGKRWPHSSTGHASAVLRLCTCV
jgi:hypothetical protein